MVFSFHDPVQPMVPDGSMRDFLHEMRGVSARIRFRACLEVLPEIFVAKTNH